MATVVESEKKVKKIVKAAILELLEERRDMVIKMLEEAFSDSPLFEALTGGGSLPSVNKGSGFKVLENVKKKSSSTRVSKRTVKPKKKTPSTQKAKPRSKTSKTRTRP